MATSIATNVSDGLSDNFAGPSHRSADGLLYFGGTKGMTVVNPDKVQRITCAAPSGDH